MSNARFDPVLVRALAAELAATLHGRMAHAAPIFDSDLSATLLLDRGQALRWDLHPTRGWVRLVPRPAEMEGRPAEARIVRVAAPDDERLLRIDLHEGNRFRGGSRALVLELHTNQWNALLVDAADRRIVSLLRTREAGGRVLRSGEVYRPPEPQRRFGGEASVDAARAEWRARLRPVAPGERRGELLRHFAGSSPLNAAALLGTAAVEDGGAALDAAFGRWWAMVHRAADEPVLLVTKSGAQPYPYPLDGLSYRGMDSLLAAFEAASQAETVDTTRQRDVETLLKRARRRVEGVRRRIERLREEEAKVGEAARLRERADLLLAHVGRIQPGAKRVTVRDAEGRTLKLPVDPALPPLENAKRLYDDARRRGRAEARIPELMERAAAEEARWAEAVAALEAGDVPAWVEAALTRAEAKAPRVAANKGPRLPYRVYQTSGGLEVRVGRTSKDNDGLTFRHAAPEDVWLHARQVPGSHVVLRWTEEGAPPARDLEEAATLAAFHSKARSSGTVAVDWTRRKHVRKPRGAPPGRVMVSHAKTVFVAPDAAVEERLRGGDEG